MKPIRSSGDIALVKPNCHLGLTSRTNLLINDWVSIGTFDPNRPIVQDLSDLQMHTTK